MTSEPVDAPKQSIAEAAARILAIAATVSVPHRDLTDPSMTLPALQITDALRYAECRVIGDLELSDVDAPLAAYTASGAAVLCGAYHQDAVRDCTLRAAALLRGVKRLGAGIDVIAVMGSRSYTVPVSV